MARMRTLKPETFTSETLCLASIPARWTFAGLWTYVDDGARGKADPRLIKAAIWPLDDDITAVDVADHLDELEKLRLLCRYVHDGRTYVHVVNFGEHQHPNRPVPSKLPACPKGSHGGFDGPTGGPHDECSDDSLQTHGGGTTNSFTNTTTPSTSGTGVVDGDVDGVGDLSSSEIAARSSDADLDDESPSEREDVERLCTHLADCIEANTGERPRYGKRWRTAARLLIDRDGRTEQQVHDCIEWCQADAFWCTNILSMPKLREKYTQLRMQAQAKGRAPGLRAVSGGYQPYQNPIDDSVYDEDL